MNLFKTDTFISRFSDRFPQYAALPPWQFTLQWKAILAREIMLADEDYHVENEVAIHRSAIIEPGAVIKGPVWIGPDCFVAAHAYLRGPVMLEHAVKIGPSSEIKNSILFQHTAVAHLNYIGDSLIGSHVNFEAGSIVANHYNERLDKRIFVFHEGSTIDTACTKFGALVGDHCKIGANAVLSPGTLLQANSIVGRLQLVQQHP